MGEVGDPIRPGKALNNNNLTCKECPKPVSKEATNGGVRGEGWEGGAGRV